MNTLYPTSKKARTAITMIWIVAFFASALLLSEVLGLLGFIDYNAPDADWNGNWEIFLVYFRLFSIAGVCTVFLISAVTFIRWFWPLYRNLHDYNPDLVYTHTWAVWCWFIPFANWFIPYRIWRELFEETNILFSRNSSTRHIRLDTGRLKRWWAYWLLCSIAALEAVLFNFFLPETITSSVFILLLSALLIWGAVITVGLIREYTVAEHFFREIGKKKL
ncbi:DUF4328 domain-containing protein [Dysgonomonas sp. 25]|uniref:DUF4328 domain-containing protein n=1 Tax=Dysgonomonas sp. 25 TaxID=2302933 RepID=UPI0013D20F3D|nr:DUF4328 domain-containing protein [Dysgonomonas sp. 25]NDV69149.1 DUF4328 domain-containing protein [Dysgonomonas sp. 25]